jgi:hypothetical protein
MPNGRSNRGKSEGTNFDIIKVDLRTDSIYMSSGILSLVDDIDYNYIVSYKFLYIRTSSHANSKLNRIYMEYGIY